MHYGKPGTGFELTAGMTFTIEPMINAGRRDVRLLPDGWTVVTKDQSLSAQWEHTILVTDTGFEVLTLERRRWNRRRGVHQRLTAAEFFRGRGSRLERAREVSRTKPADWAYLTAAPDALHLGAILTRSSSARFLTAARSC